MKYFSGNLSYPELPASFANGFSFQLVAFGMRGYFTDNFGANVELGIGSPHFISMGLNYRF